MNSTDLKNDLAESLSRLYLAFLSERLPKHIRTFGFEYEFLPGRILDMNDMVRLDRLLEGEGGVSSGGERLFESGIRVTFEPGGQIEYCSPPLMADDHVALDALLSFIEQLNLKIFEQLGIFYHGTGYIPGRGRGPLCLRSRRYLNLHKRLAKSGTRGHEMMKGTAAIHLHVAICRIDEIPPLFNRLCEMAASESFRMSECRRDIWNNTDPVRCGPPPCCFEIFKSPEALIEKWVRYGLKADVLGEDQPFEAASDRTFEAFLYHMTTIFTDIRFNLKGPTLELRTLDSVPVDQFKSRWLPFMDNLQNIPAQEE